MKWNTVKRDVWYAYINRIMLNRTMLHVCSIILLSIAFGVFVNAQMVVLCP